MAIHLTICQSKKVLPTLWVARRGVFRNKRESFVCRLLTLNFDLVFGHCFEGEKTSLGQSKRISGLRHHFRSSW